MINQGFPKSTSPVIGKHRETFQITYLGTCLFESNTPDNMVFIFDGEIGNTTFHILPNPIHRAIRWMARGILLGQAKALGNIPE
jgi:hypothetical protein